MAGHLLRQEEVGRQHPAAREDHAYRRAGRVSRAVPDAPCFYSWAWLTFSSFNRKIRHYVAIKRPHVDNNNQVGVCFTNTLKSSNLWALKWVWKCKRWWMCCSWKKKVLKNLNLRSSKAFKPAWIWWCVRPLCPAAAARRSAAAQASNVILC